MAEARMREGLGWSETMGVRVYDPDGRGLAGAPGDALHNRGEGGGGKAAWQLGPSPLSGARKAPGAARRQGLQVVTWDGESGAQTVARDEVPAEATGSDATGSDADAVGAESRVARMRWTESKTKTRPWRRRSHPTGPVCGSMSELEWKQAAGQAKPCWLAPLPRA